MCRCKQVRSCFCLPKHQFRLYSGNEPIKSGCLFWDRATGRARRVNVSIKQRSVPKARAFPSTAATRPKAKIGKLVREGRFLPLCSHIHYGRVMEETLRFMAHITTEPAKTRASKYVGDPIVYGVKS